MQALYIGPSREALCNFLPILTVELGDRPRQLLILFGCPVTLVCAILVLGRPSLVDVGVLLLAANDLSLGGVVELFTLRRSGEEVHIGDDSVWGVVSSHLLQVILRVYEGHVA